MTAQAAIAYSIARQKVRCDITLVVTLARLCHLVVYYYYVGLLSRLRTLTVAYAHGNAIEQRDFQNNFGVILYKGKISSCVHLYSGLLSTPDLPFRGALGAIFPNRCTESGDIRYTEKDL